MKKKCLQCENEFEAKRESAKFCSTNCRVKSFNKHGKKGAISPNLLQAVFNQVLEALTDIKQTHTITQPTHVYVPKNEQITVSHEPRVILRSAEQWHELKRDCASREEWEQIKEQINLASNLSSKQKQFIISTS